MTEIQTYTPAPWQAEDLEQLEELDFSANWSQMGCFKTSTALWLTDRKLSEIENPAVLIVTTASGKGAYFRDVPRTIGSKWQIINYKADGFYLIVNGMQIKIGQTRGKKEKGLAPKIEFPHIVVTHYHLFSRSNMGKFDECKTCDGRGLSEDFLQPCFVCDGKGKIPKKPTVADQLLERKWDLLILDEAHRIKDREAKWTVNIKKIKTDRKHIMTGSGFVNRPDEIWSLLNFLDSDTYSSYWRFREDFCEEDNWDGYRKVRGLNEWMVPEFRRIRASFGPRRTKPEVFPHLKEPLYEDITIDLNDVQRRMYDQIKYELMLLDQKGEPLHSPNVLSQLQRLRQICVATPDVIFDDYVEKEGRRVTKIQLIEPSSKLDALMDIIDGLQWDDEDKQQIVVFSNFRDPLVLLQKRLDKSGIPWIRLNTEDNDSVRYQKWAVEFPKKNHQVFMSTIKLGGESIDLTCADYVCQLDLDWAPMNNDQAIERVWRPSGDVKFDTERSAPIVVRIFAEDTVDQYMLDMNDQKANWFQKIFGANPLLKNQPVTDTADDWAKML